MTNRQGTGQGTGQGADQRAGKSPPKGGKRGASGGPAKGAGAAARKSARPAKAGTVKGKPAPGAAATGRATDPAGPGPSGRPPAAAADAATGLGRGARMLLWAVAVALVVGAGGALTWSFLPRGPAAPDQAALAAQLDALEGRIAALSAEVAEMPGAKAVTDAEAAAALVAEQADGLARRIRTLEELLARLDASVAALGAAVEKPRSDPVAAAASEAAARNTAALEELERRVGALESAPRQVAAAAGPGQQALAVAVSQLREALRGPGPFAPEMEILDSLAGGNAEVAQALADIAPAAEKGIPTREDLRERFADVAGAVVRAAEGPEEGGWVGEALSTVASVVTVRRTGADVPGDSPEAVVARAEALLEEDDLAAAVEELTALVSPGPLAEEWLADARARLSAEEALKTLQALVIGQIAQGDGAAE